MERAKEISFVIALDGEEDIGLRILNGIGKAGRGEAAKAKIYVFTKNPSPMALKPFWSLIFGNMKHSLHIYMKPLDEEEIVKVVRESRQPIVYVSGRLVSLKKELEELGVKPIVLGDGE